VLVVKNQAPNLFWASVAVEPVYWHELLADQRRQVSDGKWLEHQ